MGRMKIFLKIICLLLITLVATPALAEGKYASIVVDAATGKVLESTNAQATRHPASLTKMMTLYLTFKALRQGKLRINQALPVSEFAAAQAPSKLGLTPGSVIRVRDAILGLVTQSANDAAVVLAEAQAGSEGAFARRMTEQARALGMKQTVYRNASGLPDDDQITTARDMAILGRALYFNFPDYYRFFSTPSFSYRGHTYKNHNKLMSRYHGMDGIKTGYIRASGFNLVASAAHGKSRLIAVIFGGESARERDRAMAALLDGTFAKIARNNLKGKSATLPLVAQTLPNDSAVAQGDAKEETDNGEEAEDAPQNGQAASATPSVAARVPDSAAADPTQATGHDDAAAMPALRLASPIILASASTVAPGAPDGIKLPSVKPPSTLSHATKTLETTSATAKKPVGWTVQLGSYTLKSSATQNMKKAEHRLPKNLRAAQPAIATLEKKGQKPTYAPQWSGLSKTQAKQICRLLGKASHCRTIAPKGHDD